MLCVKPGRLLSVCAGVSQAQSMGVCPCFLTHLECMLSVVVKTDRQEEYRYAHTDNMTPCVSSLSQVTICWVQSYCAYKNYMNFSTLFICESLHDFFALNGSINLEDPIYKFARLEFDKF